MSTKEDLKNKIDYEFNQINKEYELIELLIKKSAVPGFDPIELRATSASLQSVYNGFEKMIIQFFKQYNFSIPNSHSWHSDLLKMAIDQKIISPDLEKCLRDYMGFRHFIRHAYSFMIDFDLLKPLILNLEFTIRSLKSELNEFIESN